MCKPCVLLVINLLVNIYLAQLCKVCCSLVDEPEIPLDLKLYPLARSQKEMVFFFLCLLFVYQLLFFFFLVFFLLNILLIIVTCV